MKITGNEPANPIVNSDGYCTLIDNVSSYEATGLTIRQQFAMAAMQGLLTRVPKRHNGETDLGILECKRIIEESIIMADALIEELNKEKT